jgi:hypothetical protein
MTGSYLHLFALNDLQIHIFHHTNGSRTICDLQGAAHNGCKFTLCDIEYTDTLEKFGYNSRNLLSAFARSNDLPMPQYQIELNLREGKYQGLGYLDATDNYVRDGLGEMQYTHGDVYEGAWKDGKKEGQGTMRYADGAVYEGEWKGNKRDGQGTYRWADGAVYEGAWNDG